MKHNLLKKIKNFKKNTWCLIVLFVWILVIGTFEIELTFWTTFIVVMSTIIIGTMLKRIVDKCGDNNESA
ncbi:hypothetical protein [Oceanobacillus jeddahense]|uniref:Uncharacterized protein n=1 Tax=Oceanobacillus jeddahense TaxID=1462527 RepID=A0ABY5K1P4_9BACI|nr:hypothetical protein [Oceanobacillus jeddahense]UUI05216.1 hypothetical protein NP439_11475 [Oceanobacillus jeddahense]